MVGERCPVRLLTMKLIPNLSGALARALALPPELRSVGLLSTDCDDVTYLALDEATKQANVRVIYGRSLYAGAANATTRSAGEVIGILAGPTPSEVESGLRCAAEFLRGEAGFRRANDDGSVVYLSHCVSSAGTYLANIADVPVGSPLAYLVAPPVEAVAGLDAALKAAEVELAALFEPPTETNFGGGLLTGTQSACQAACAAFAETVQSLAARPIEEEEKAWNWQKT